MQINQIILKLIYQNLCIFFKKQEKITNKLNDSYL